MIQTLAGLDYCFSVEQGSDEGSWVEVPVLVDVIVVFAGRLGSAHWTNLGPPHTPSCPSWIGTPYLVVWGIGRSAV